LANSSALPDPTDTPRVGGDNARNENIAANGIPTATPSPTLDPYQERIVNRDGVTPTKVSTMAPVSPAPTATLAAIMDSRRV
jgi:hypothetical protein